MICKECKKELPETEFYSWQQTYNTKNGIKYCRVYKSICKECYIAKRSLNGNNRVRRNMKPKESPKVENIIFDEATIKVKNKKSKIPLWILRNLKNYGNCYIRNNTYDLDYLGQIIGKKIEIKNLSVGFILQKKGN